MTAQDKIKNLIEILHDRSELENVSIIVYAESAADIDGELVEKLEQTGYKRFADNVSRKTLEYGDSNKSVALLQAALNYLGFDSGAIDGIYGGNTQSAVYRYQDCNGLKADGVAGTETINKIVERIANGT